MQVSKQIRTVTVCLLAVGQSVFSLFCFQEEMSEDMNTTVSLNALDILSVA